MKFSDESNIESVCVPHVRHC